MFIAWTTVATQQDADRMAAEAVARGLAACVQVEPVVSHYLWEGKQERAEELRLAFKCLPEKLPQLEAFVLASHPYANPEWIALRADRISEKYLSWAEKGR